MNDSSEEEEEIEDILITEDDLKLEFFKHSNKKLDGFVGKIQNNFKPDVIEDSKHPNQTLCSQCGKYVNNGTKALLSHMRECSSGFRCCNKCKEYYKINNNSNKNCHMEW